MANGSLEKLALATMIAGSSLLGVNSARAAPVNWSSITDIVDNQTGSIGYDAVNSTSLPNRLTAICYVVSPMGNSFAVGGFDMVNGQVTTSYFNSMNLPTTIGLTQGDTANTGDGANPQNAYEVGWEVFYDFNGDGILGTIDDVGKYLLDRSEVLDSSQYTISNSSPFEHVNPGSFTFSTTIPEPSTFALLALGGAAALGCRRRVGPRAEPKDTKRE